MKISIIVPIYNVKKYLAKCLDSVINQTLRDVEIICVNDGSTDGSAEILQEYSKKDDRIIVINQKNQGLSAARNSAMVKARGEFLGFVDSDDWISENYFEELYNVAKKYSAEVSCCSFMRAYSSGKLKKRFDVALESVFEDASLKFRAADMPKCCYVFNKLFKRELIERLGLKFISGMYFEDTYFSIRAVYFANKLAVTPATMYYYRVNENSITRGEQTDKKQIDRRAAKQDFIQFAYKHYIKCDEKYFMKEKILHYIGGILVMKICVWETIKKYYLFGGIKIWETRRY